MGHHVEANAPRVENAEPGLPAAGPDGAGAIAPHAHHRAGRDAAAATWIVAEQAEARRRRIEDVQPDGRADPEAPARVLADARQVVVPLAGAFGSRLVPVQRL